ncbi:MULTISPECIES: bifunctional diguanylate cyclase/phosphodiesterase [Lelliottia]|jgi:EAL domain-containing protein (putative c-di-GMP-specific phosphodiesterase class I)/GGDEF domain-containing protein|uniref:Sensor domain-containing phosphodiesterase n=1 Tax=Lelliottia aquatilis TaxID=2080838 RepID=A0ABX4ZZP6_9ENTR|nr:MULTISPECIES: EAL domain-containing protein [Lelliottia]ASV56407.1 cytochrome C-type biogenesis protein [Lelliottia jeotgali]MBL5883326.1 EAL domain-containing protein [Lelliottia aquatilis]NTZ45359.1 EAL domain-containing protein [Lelliottia aquatilis]POZ19060.1 sensor domain-containing phosphodiesterase [Lelliottia sp. 7254-16]POZ21924.1 sensor domain-containing phosphodiesterase [Lelliottia aquatilis]
MKIIPFLKRHKDRWWALPLVLPVIFLPILSFASTYTHLNGGIIALYYMPLAFLLSTLLFFGFAALPGILLALFLRYYPDTSVFETIAVICHFIVPLIISWGGYRVFAPRRNMVAYGDIRLMSQRIFWQVLCPSTLFLVLFQFAVYLGIYESRQSLAGLNPLSIHTLINYQGLLVGGLTGVPLSYLLIRVIRHPRYLKRLASQIRAQIDKKVTVAEFILWGAALASLLCLLLFPMSDNSSIFSTNYTLSLLMPLMLWGSMRFGYKLISIVWTPVLMVAIHYFYRYIPLGQGYDVQLAITSSSYLVFSFVVIYMAMLATRQREITRHASRLAFLDPMVHMPNLRALSRSLAKSPWSALCMLRVPELEVLGRNYGVLLRIQYKQKLAEWLNGSLQQNECVYQLSGHDLAIRLNTESHAARIEALDEHIKQFRFIWDGMPLQPQVGISYCCVRSPVNHLYLLLGELSIIADLSLSTNHPESLQQRGAANLQRSLKDKVAMMNRLQRALDHNEFQLVAQRVQGIRGDHYHEILLRMQSENGALIAPDKFLPVAQEFGLSSRVDLWVLERTLQFMAEHRDRLRGKRFAINLSPSTLCRSHFPVEVHRLLKKYSIEAWQLIFEITECSGFGSADLLNQIVKQLQKMGCRIAIDDFGTGYASYARLKSVDADILKIDGSFIRNIADNSLDYQIVASICHLARMKKMLVVAEFVESEAIRSAVDSLGIDYLQGYLIGKPEALETLLHSQASPIDA